MPAKKPDPTAPESIHADVEAALHLLASLRKEHWTAGNIVVGRVHLLGVADEHPLRKLEQQGQKPATSAPAPDDDMDAFR